MSRERLRAAARERWGDVWTLVTREWADGDAQTVAYTSRGRGEDGETIVREQLLLDDDGDIVRERVVLRPQRILERERL